MSVPDIENMTEEEFAAYVKGMEETRAAHAANQIDLSQLPFKDSPVDQDLQPFYDQSVTDLNKFSAEFVLMTQLRREVLSLADLYIRLLEETTKLTNQLS